MAVTFILILLINYLMRVNVLMNED